MSRRSQALRDFMIRRAVPSVLIGMETSITKTSLIRSRRRRYACVAAGLTLAGASASVWPDPFRRSMLMLFVWAIVTLHFAGWLWLPNASYRLGTILFVPAYFMPFLWQLLCMGLFIGFVAYGHLMRSVKKAIRSKRGGSSKAFPARRSYSDGGNGRRRAALHSFDDHGM